jgi:hypothetical protein
VETIGPILAVGAVLALIVGVVMLNFRIERKRTEAMAAACQAMGYTFEEKGDVEALRTFGDLPVFDHGHSKTARNVMTGTVANHPVKLFDYRYTTGSGKNSHTYRQTVALFPGGAQGLPDFALAPENFFHKIGGFFGYQDIDFEASPDFSSHYLLRGSDEMAIRTAFSADALSFFAQQRGWNVEVRSAHAGVYRSGKQCKPEEAPAYLAEALNVVRAVVRG